MSSAYVYVSMQGALFRTTLLWNTMSEGDTVWSVMIIMMVKILIIGTTQMRRCKATPFSLNHGD